MGLEVVPSRDDASSGSELTVSVTFKVSKEQDHFLLEVTGQARIQDHLALDKSTVIREAIDQMRTLGGWSVHRDRLLARHQTEPGKGRRKRGGATPPT